MKKWSQYLARIIVSIVHINWTRIFIWWWKFTESQKPGLEIPRLWIFLANLVGYEMDHFAGSRKFLDRLFAGSWNFLDHFAGSWNFLDRFAGSWNFLDQFAGSWNFLDRFAGLWNFLDRFEGSWNFFGHFKNPLRPLVPVKSHNSLRGYMYTVSIKWHKINVNTVIHGV